MQYEFTGCDNPDCPDKHGVHTAVTLYVLPYPIGTAPSVGQRIPCPACFEGKITRIYSCSQQFIVRGNLTVEDAFSQGRNTANVKIGDRRMNIQFVDHPHTDPAYQAKLRQAACRHGLRQLGAAYHNEKHGRLCVDVASEVPDPLGMIERHRRQHGAETRKIAVNQPFKLPEPAAKRPIKKKSGPLRVSPVPLRRS